MPSANYARGAADKRARRREEAEHQAELQPDVVTEVVTGPDRLHLLAKDLEAHVMAFPKARALFVGHESITDFHRAINGTLLFDAGMRRRGMHTTWPAGAALTHRVARGPVDYARIARQTYTWIGVHDIELWADPRELLDYLKPIARHHPYTAHLIVTVDEERGPERAGWEWVSDYVLRRTKDGQHLIRLPR